VYCGRDLFSQRHDWLLCAGCSSKLGPVGWNGCHRCGGEVPGSEAAGDRCESCRKLALRFDSVIALGSYHAGLRDAVLRMKRPAHDALSVAMGQLLAERRRERLAAVGADMIVPIPMFWRRRIGRGKNCPELLSECLAKSLGIPMRAKSLTRRRNTLPQAGSAPRRFENVRGAFMVRRPDTVHGARVLLVDDVLTTGATCSEAANMLKQAGAAMVVVAVVARA
jgi:ComF family protein